MLNMNLVVLRALLSKKGWWALNHLLDIETFKSVEYRSLYKIIERMHDGTETDIPVEALAAEVESQHVSNTEHADSLLAYVQLIEETPEIPEDQLTALVRRFIERSNSYTIAEYITKHVEQESFDANVVAELAQRAVDVGARVSTAVTNLFETDLSGAPDTQPVRHSLGVSRQLDACLRGGVGPGELCIYLAPPAVGKTSLLCKSGAAHAQAGGGVLHVTLEINTRKVIERYDQAWTGLTSEEIATPSGQARACTARMITQKRGGSVFIVDWSYMPVTANDVGALVRKMKAQGKSISLVIIDYLGLMTPNKLPGKELRSQFSAVGKEMRQLAKNLDLPVLTAWQVNREGAKKTDALLSKEDISESWDIVMIADQIIGLNQNRAQLECKRMVLNIIKQRESTNRGHVTTYCDLERMVIRDKTAKDDFDEVREITAPGPQGTARTGVGASGPAGGDQGNDGGGEG